MDRPGRDGPLTPVPPVLPTTLRPVRRPVIAPPPAALMVPRKLLSLHELSLATGVSEKTIRRLVDRDAIPYFQPGGPGHRLLFPPDALEIGGTPTSASPPASNAGGAPGSRTRPGDDAGPRSGPPPLWRKGRELRS